MPVAQLPVPPLDRRLIFVLVGGLASIVVSNLLMNIAIVPMLEQFSESETPLAWPGWVLSALLLLVGLWCIYLLVVAARCLRWQTHTQRSQ